MFTFFKGRCQICTMILFHENTFARGTTFARVIFLYFVFFFVTIIATPNAKPLVGNLVVYICFLFFNYHCYPWSVTLFSLFSLFFNLLFIYLFLTTTVTPNPWSVTLVSLFYYFIYIFFILYSLFNYLRYT